jgi:hypothetical protein
MVPSENKKPQLSALRNGVRDYFHGMPLVGVIGPICGKLTQSF